MSISHLDLIAISERLANEGNEASWRSSVSRAYYAAYHRGMLSVHLCPDNSNVEMGSHERLSHRFELHDTNGARSIAYVLKTMKRVRNGADYEIQDGFEQSQVTNQISNFKQLINRFNSFDNTYSLKSEEG